MRLVKTYALLILVFVPLLTFSQSPEKRFRAVLAAGIVGSQVDGDTYGGYNKSGLYGGVFVNRPIGEKTELEFGITCIQKGARKNANPDQGDFSFYLFRLNYVEVPLLLKVNYKKFKFGGGLSYAYLFNSHEENTYGYYNDKRLLNRDICYNLLGEYKINDRLSAEFRYNYSLVPIRPYPSSGIYLGTFWTRLFNRGLYNNAVVLSLNYMLKGKQED